jgi:hypothetical protein
VPPCSVLARIGDDLLAASIPGQYKDASTALAGIRPGDVLADSGTPTATPPPGPGPYILIPRGRRHPAARTMPGYVVTDGRRDLAEQDVASGNEKGASPRG